MANLTGLFPGAHPPPMRTKRGRVEYKWYIRWSPAWQEKRAACLAAAGARCACGREATHAHHLTYERLGNEWPEDLEALCKACHDDIHTCPVCEGRMRWAEIESGLLMCYPCAVETEG